jgi:predicted Zn-ribbon and HTH transcriptional regulator
MKKEEAGHKVQVLGNRCYRCGHPWIPRDIDTKSAVCPKCKNPYWDKPKRVKKNGRI